jgi:hypothetical protein
VAPIRAQNITPLATNYSCPQGQSSTRPNPTLPRDQHRKRSAPAPSLDPQPKRKRTKEQKKLEIQKTRKRRDTREQNELEDVINHTGFITIQISLSAPKTRGKKTKNLSSSSPGGLTRNKSSTGELDPPKITGKIRTVKVVFSLRPSRE